MTANFICKPSNLEEVLLHGHEVKPEEFRIIATEKVSETEWDSLTQNFLADRDWIAILNEKPEQCEDFDIGKRNCIEVTCEGKKGAILIDPQGYTYARYVAILED